MFRFVVICYIFTLIIPTSACAEIRAVQPGLTPKLIAYGDSLKAIAAKSPLARKLFDYSAKHCVPFPQPTMITTQNVTQVAVFTASRSWKEFAGLKDAHGVYDNKRKALLLQDDLTSWPHMGVAFLHELVHLCDDNHKVLVYDNRKGQIEAELRAFAVMYCALNDLADKKLLEVFQRVDLKMYRSENGLYFISHAQAAEIDRRLGFPRAQTMADLQIRQSNYNACVNLVLAKSEHELREVIRKWYGWTDRPPKKS